MPLSYEDLPTAIRDHIIWQLRKAKLRATLVIQKYTRGRYPRLAYKRAKVWSRNSGPNESRSNIMPFMLNYFRRDPEDEDYRIFVNRRRQWREMFAYPEYNPPPPWRRRPKVNINKYLDH